MTSALIIDDHHLFAGGFSYLLQSMDEIDYVHCFTDPQSAYDFNSENEVILIVSDLYIPGYDMYVWFAKLKLKFSDSRLLVISSSISRSDRDDSLAAGADIYFEKHADPHIVVSGVKDLFYNKPISDDFLNRTAAEAQSYGLTHKQIDILVYLARGLSLKEIALRFEISPETVKSHLARIYQVIGVSGRSAASLWARRHKLI